MTTKQPTKKTIKRLRIKHALERLGHSFASIGQELDITRQAVSKAVVKPSPRVANAIATKLGSTPAKIWPERFAA